MAIPGPQIPLLPPGQAMWMTRPPPHPNCPPGLEYLLQVDSLHMKQIPSFVEALTGWDTNNKYLISNNQGIQMYYAAEKSDTCMRLCCGTQREFTIHIVDYSNQEVFRVHREFKCCAGGTCCAGCCDCCAHEITVSTPTGQVLGYVKQVGSFLGVKYHIMDESHQPILRLNGPACILDGPCCPCDNEFKLLAMQTDDQIGSLKKIYAGFLNEMVSTADRFGISFPVDLHVNVKATLLGALFLIDFMMFEQKQKNNQTY